MGSTAPLRGIRRALITAGATRARLDAVRFIMNTSSGALGAALAVEGLARGWGTDFVHGPWSACPPVHERLSVHAVSWLEELVPTLRGIPRPDHIEVVFHAMAVLDYAPAKVEEQKRSSGHPWMLKLSPTPKVIDSMSSFFPNAMLIAFKLEKGVSERELALRAARLAHRSGAHLVVANLLEWVQHGYRCHIIDSSGLCHAEVEGREKTARWLWDYVGRSRTDTGERTRAPLQRSTM